MQYAPAFMRIATQVSAKPAKLQGSKNYENYPT